MVGISMVVIVGQKKNVIKGLEQVRISDKRMAKKINLEEE